MISCPSPWPRLQRQSLDVCPDRRWPQYKITFRVLSLTLPVSRTCRLEIAIFFFFFLAPAQASAKKSGLLAARRWAQYELTVRVFSLSLRCFFGARLHGKLKRLWKFARRAFAFKRQCSEECLFRVRRDFCITLPAVSLSIFRAVSWHRKDGFC